MDAERLQFQSPARMFSRNQSRGYNRPKIFTYRDLELLIIRALPQLIGLGYMFYFFINEEHINSFLYCGLCKADVHFNNLIGHLVGVNHRLNYCYLHFPLLTQDFDKLKASCKDVLLDYYLTLVAPEISKLSSIKMPLGFAEGLDIETIRQQVKNGCTAGIHVNTSSRPNLEQRLINICIKNGIEAAVQLTEKVDLNGDPASLIINLILRLQRFCPLDSKKLNTLKRLAKNNTIEKIGDRKFFEDHKQFLLECYELINKTVLAAPFDRIKNKIKVIIENKVQQVEEQAGNDHQPKATLEEGKNLHLNFVLQAPGDSHDVECAPTPSIVDQIEVLNLLGFIKSLQDHCGLNAKEIKILTEASIKLGPNSKIMFTTHKNEFLNYRSKISETQFDEGKLKNLQSLIVAVIKKKIPPENQEDNGAAIQKPINEDDGSHEGLNEDDGASFQDAINEKQPSGSSSAASEDSQQADDPSHFENDTQEVYTSSNSNYSQQNTFAHEHYVSNLHPNQPQSSCPIKYVIPHRFYFYATAPGMTYDVYN